MGTMDRGRFFCCDTSVPQGSQHEASTENNLFQVIFLSAVFIIADSCFSAVLLKNLNLIICYWEIPVKRMLLLTDGDLRSDFPINTGSHYG